jgi:hypothetical protein
LIGPLANRPRFGRWSLPILSIGSSTLFFLTSNLATWGEGLLYPLTFSGLVMCYTQAIPFFRNTVISDLVGTALLFGLAPLFERAVLRLTQPRLAEVTVEARASHPSRRA